MVARYSSDRLSESFIKKGDELVWFQRMSSMLSVGDGVEEKGGECLVFYLLALLKASACLCMTKCSLPCRWITPHSLVNQNLRPGLQTFPMKIHWRPGILPSFPQTVWKVCDCPTSLKY